MRVKQEAELRNEIEQCVLGAMTLDAQCQKTGLLTIKPDWFYYPFNKKIFEAMAKMAADSISIDYMTLRVALKEEKEFQTPEGKIYLIEMCEFLPTTVHFEDYLREFKSFVSKDKLGQLSEDIRSRSSNGEPEIETIGFVKSELNKIGLEATPSEVQNSVKDVLWELYSEVTNPAKEKKVEPKTGLKDLDKLLGNLNPSNMIILAGRTSMGKSALVVNIALYNAMTEKLPVLIFSLEMPLSEVAQRMVSLLTHIPMKRFREANMSEADRGKMLEAMNKISAAPIFIEEVSSKTDVAIRARALQMKEKKSIRLVIVDHLQSLDTASKSKDQYHKLTELSKSMKNMAMELSLPVIVVSQLTRAPEQTDSKKPRLKDLRDSGAIEENADVVLLLYRAEYYKESEENIGKAEIIVGKQRNGPTGTVQVVFQKEWMGFANLSKQEEESK